MWGRTRRPHPRVEHHLALPVAGLELSQGQGFQLGQGHGVCRLLSFFTTCMLFVTSLRMVIVKLRTVAQTHENGPTWVFPGRPAVSVHRALAGFCGGSGRARQTSRGHAGGRAGRTAIMGGPRGQALSPGRCFMVLSPPCNGIPTEWDFCDPAWDRRPVRPASMRNDEIRRGRERRPDWLATHRRGDGLRCAGPDD